jgi:hypothetical protein
MQILIKLFKIAFLTINLLLLFSSCDDNIKIQITEYNLKDYVYSDSAVFLNDIALDIDYIKLETSDSSYIGDIHQLDKDGSDLFILDRHYKITHFNDKGCFVNTIGQIGEGPGEFLEPIAFALFPKKEIIAVYDVAKKKIILFNYTADYISEFRISVFALKIENLADSLITVAIPFPEIVSNNNYGVSIFNLEGDLTDRVINRKKEVSNRHFDSNSPIEGRQFLKKAGDKVKYWEMGNDTVYSISLNGKVEREYLICNSTQDKSNSSGDIVENSIWYGKILDTDSYLFISPCILNNEVKSLMVNKSEGNGYNIMVHNNLNKSLQLQSGIINNIDGGWPINPINITSSGDIYTTFFGHELITQLETGLFDNQEILNPSKRLELDSLLSISGIYDNPIIMLVSLNK